MHTIRAVRLDDAAAICAIYNHYVLTSAISFEETPVSETDMAERIRSTSAWIVLEENGVLAGYAYAGAWKARSAYRFSVESTVYISPDHQRQGIGRKLYRSLLADLRAGGVHTVIGSIALPNAASIALHEAVGFKEVARMLEVGRKFDRWIDVGYWQLML